MGEQTGKSRSAVPDAEGAADAPAADEVMAYVADMCRQLAGIARQHGRERVAALLDMAQNEVKGPSVKH